MSERVARGTPDPLEHASSDKQYPTDPRGELDAGLPERIPPCMKRTWCVLSLDHRGRCVEVPSLIPQGEYQRQRRSK